MKKQTTERKGLAVAIARLVSVFYEWCPPYCYTKGWQGRAYYDVRRNRVLMVFYPFHWLVSFAWWANWKWAKHRNRESWIDRQLSR